MENIANDENRNGDSHVMKISIRAWLSIILVITVCIMSAVSRPIIEPLYSLTTLAVGFYFGQKTK